MKAVRIFIVSVFFIGFSSFAFGSVSSVSEEILRQIEENGSASLIVGFHVEDYDAMINSSIQKRKVNSLLKSTMGVGVQGSVNRADDILKERIAAAAQDTFSSDDGLSKSVATVDKPKVLRVYNTLPYAVVTVEDESSYLRLKSMDNVTSISLNSRWVLPQADTSNDTARIPEVWNGNPSYTGDGQFIAVIDTGIYADHEAFEGKTIVESCFKSAALYDENEPGTSCLDGNIKATGPGSAAHDEVNGSGQISGFYHGTQVASLALGNSNSYKGAAKDADLLISNVFSIRNGSVTTYSDAILAALEWVYLNTDDYTIAAVNLSVGGSTQYSSSCDVAEKALYDLVNNLRQVNVAVVSSTGNDYSCEGVSSPSCLSNVISVGSIDFPSGGDEFFESSFSNFGKGMVDLYAVGREVDVATGGSGTNAYGNGSGTSFSSPVVAGAWAILSEAQPTHSVYSIFEALDAKGGSVEEGVGFLKVCTDKPDGKNIDVKSTVDYINSDGYEPTPEPEPEKPSDNGSGSGSGSGTSGGSGCSALSYGGTPYLFVLLLIFLSLRMMTNFRQNNNK